MIITKSQLQKWVKIPENIYEITNEHITEVDSYIENYVKASGIVTGKVLTKEKHPNADTLSLTTVDVGDGEIKNIVCGASNVAAGQYVVVALVGAVLPGDFMIKDAVIRGVASHGMICSLSELHVKDIPEEYQNGIFFFPEPVELGINALDALNMNGFVMELDLTPNSGHLLSTLGYAYDIAAITNQKITLPTYQVEEIEKVNPLQVKIEDNGATRYYARMAEVKVKASPWWLQSELIKRGIDPINNVVDISNFIMFEYGTPLHMFDADLFGSENIVIRNAKPNEKVVTLSDHTFELSAQDLVITNGQNPTAVAGVVGLKNSMIVENTTKIIIEAAHFKSERIQATASKIGRTDSSIRFERGVDQSIVKLALETASYLLVKYADAKVYKGISQAETLVMKPHQIILDKKYVNKLLGTKLSLDMIVSLLTRFQFDVKVKNDLIEVVVPLRRPDLKIPADLVEEIGRLYGYNNIKNAPLIDSLSGGKTALDHKETTLRNNLAALGLNEVITYSLIDSKSVHKFNNLGTPYEVLMPLTEDRKVMRQSLLNGLFQTYQYNIARQNKIVNIFEIGSVYSQQEEKKYLSMLLNSKLNYNVWQKDAIGIDFYYVKGLIENLLAKLKISLDYQESHNESLHPYRQAYIINNEKTIGIIGEIHPSLSKDDRAYVIELDLDYILHDSFTNEYLPISKYPNVERDIAFIISKEVTSTSIEQLITQTARKYLVKLELFDVYEGESIPQNHRSLAYRLVFNSKEGTLESSDVEKIMKSVVNRLFHVYKAEIR